MAMPYNLIRPESSEPSITPVYDAYKEQESNEGYERMVWEKSQARNISQLNSELYDSDEQPSTPTIGRGLIYAGEGDIKRVNSIKL